MDRYLINNEILHFRKVIPRIGEGDNIVCTVIPEIIEERATKLANKELISAQLGVERIIIKLKFNYELQNSEDILFMKNFSK